MKRFECVPNFSEGRDPVLIAALADAARSVPGVTVLDVESNADHHRCVISLVGEGEPLLEGVFRMMRLAVERIDLRNHIGEHPRMGAVDVVPFVPLGEASATEAVVLAERLAERSWRELRLPVYLYASAARRPERTDLAVVRRGQFEGIRDSIGADPDRRPDVGDAAVHPSAGIVAIGARPLLIAYNAYLTTPDVAVAKKVARAVRARDGGLAEVKALGFEIKERNRAQVSMNLTDYHQTPVHRALEAVRREAARFGAGIEESEIVGLVPEDALLDAAEYYLQLNRFDRATILERKLRAAEGGPPSVPASAPTAERPLLRYLDQLAARTPTPGGGSAAGVAGSLGSSLGTMVVAYSAPAGALPPGLAAADRELREATRRFLELADEDVAAYDAVRSARKAAKASPGGDPGAAAAVRAAIRSAAEVPLATAQLARRIVELLDGVRPLLKASVESDRVSARALLGAALVSARANVAINLADLRDQGAPDTALEAALAAIAPVPPE